MRPLLSLRDLSARLGVPLPRLRLIAADIENQYAHWTVPQGPDKVRQLRVPKAELRDLQRRINQQILAPIALSQIAHGGVKGRSPSSNASVHLGQPCVVTLDARNFFPSVRHYVVYRMFRRELRFGRAVARLLTRLTTIDSQLPQGAPTSTAVANLVMTVAVDAPLAAKSAAEGISCSRFVDDITLSGHDPRRMINVVARLLSSRRLPMYRKRSRKNLKQKLRISPRSKPQEVTGLNVNSARGPSTPRKYRDKIKAAIHELGKISDVHERGKAMRSIAGRIAYVKPFNPGSARRLRALLDAAL